MGLWDERVHRDATERWAILRGYPPKVAHTIGVVDNDVDNKKSWRTEPGTQYHFDRSLSMSLAGDTRIAKYIEHFKYAQDFCSVTEDDPQSAIQELGTSLHPYQDYVAHGDHNKWIKGSFKNIKDTHNYMSPLKGSTHFPDNPFLDAVNSPDHGREVGAALHMVSDGSATRDWALYRPGYQRLTLTLQMTMQALNSYRSYLVKSGGCKCKEYFGVK